MSGRFSALWSQNTFFSWHYTQRFRMTMSNAVVPIDKGLPGELRNTNIMYRFFDQVQGVIIAKSIQGSSMYQISASAHFALLQAECQDTLNSTEVRV